MRCPKCSYLSYDDLERCRNCGYDFSLAATPREPDAPPVLVEPTHEPRAWEPTRRRRPGLTDPAPTGEDAPLDLPLFDESSAPAAPEPPPVAIPPAGPPLSVRRKIDLTRPSPRAEPREVADGGPAITSFAWPDEPSAPDVPGAAPADVTPADVTPPADADRTLGPRIRAGLVDLVVLGLTDLLVVWLTLRVAGVSSDDWNIVPRVPLFGFLFLLDTAYLVTFTAASGQTIGKMMAGLRVVYGEDGGRVPFGHTVLRSVAVLLCAIPAGLGFLPVFMDPERRGAHDRLAGTRVVPAD